MILLLSENISMKIKKMRFNFIGLAMKRALVLMLIIVIVGYANASELSDLSNIKPQFMRSLMSYIIKFWFKPLRWCDPSKLISELDDLCGKGNYHLNNLQTNAIISIDFQVCCEQLCTRNFLRKNFCENSDAALEEDY